MAKSDELRETLIKAMNKAVEAGRVVQNSRSALVPLR